MKSFREAIRRVIAGSILPRIERDGIKKLILPDQITPADCAKPMKCTQPPRWKSRRQELMVGLTGKAPYCIDYKTFIFTPGRILLLPNGVRRGPAHASVRFNDNINPNRLSSFLLVESHPSGVRLQLLRAVDEPNVLEATQQYLFLGRHFGRLATCLMEEVRSRPSNYARISRCVLMEFWERVLSATADITAGIPTPSPGFVQTRAGDKPMPDRVRAAVEFIHSHYHIHGLNLSDIAEAADTSDGYLIDQFRTSVGLTPIAYLMEIRMEAAMRLLLTDVEIKVSEVGVMVGIPDPAYFSRLFRRSNGVSPARYRKISASSIEQRKTQ